MLEMHLIGSDIQVMSVFCRGWRNLVILVGSISKFSLLNVSMNEHFRRKNGEKSHLCCSYEIVNVCMYFIMLGVTGKVLVVWGFFLVFLRI